MQQTACHTTAHVEVGRVTESLPRNDAYALFKIIFWGTQLGPAAAAPAAPAPMALYTGQQSLHKTAYTSTSETRGHVPRPHLLRIKATPSTYQKSNRRSTIENRQSNRKSTIESMIDNRKSTIESKIDNRKSAIESEIDNRIEDRQSKIGSLIEDRQPNRRSTIDKRNRILSYLALHKSLLSVN